MARCNECMEDVEYLPDDNYCEHCLDDFEEIWKAAEKRKKKTQWMELVCAIEVNVDEETVNKELLDWVESNGWSFTGTITHVEE